MRQIAEPATTQGRVVTTTQLMRAGKEGNKGINTRGVCIWVGDLTVSMVGSADLNLLVHFLHMY